MDPIREFIRAFNEQDLDALAAVLDPEVEIHSGRGLRKGIDAARAWATRTSGGAQQTVVLEELYEEPDKAAALIKRLWHWEEDGSLAREEEMAWLFELRDRRIRSWRPFEDRDEALREAGFLAG
ncbi:MAG TPA: nuclear transport factor 2 family protein [Solirubrobacterales bacterium]|nr:nuclear transport factor 2 family protein [Solirubrobacterales bacterium]